MQKIFLWRYINDRGTFLLGIYMARQKKLFHSQEIALNELLQEAILIRDKLKGRQISELIRLLRLRLQMSQKILAARSGLTQSAISKIESGQAEIPLSTLRKALRALFCDLLLIPVPNKNLDDTLREQAMKAANKRIRYAAGTMSLEDQLPGEKLTHSLAKREAERLLIEKSTKIWDD